MVNKKSYIIRSDSVFFSEEKINSNLNMKLLLFTERTLNNHDLKKITSEKYFSLDQIITINYLPFQLTVLPLLLVRSL